MLLFSMDFLNKILKTACDSGDPYKLTKNKISLLGNILHIDPEERDLSFDLDSYDRIIVLGAGKGTAKMALALEEILGGRISEGSISVKEGYTENLKIIKTIEAEHPVPGKNSLRAGAAVTELCAKRDKKNLYINLISGGGSALLCAPYDDGRYAVTFEEKQKVTSLLLACGGDIKEFNAVRKHLSMIKGGRLAELIYPAESINLILSDVTGNPLDVIASGLTVPDRSTYADVKKIFKKYNLENEIPRSVMELTEAGIAGAVPETPKPGDRIFDKSANILIGTNRIVLENIKKFTEHEGFNSAILASELTGEAKETAKFFFAAAKEIAGNRGFIKRPAALLAGGETTVTLRGNGKGGRNQETALSFLISMKNSEKKLSGVTFISFGTDGTDGPTDAAGAFVSNAVLEKAEAMDIDPEAYLKNNDSYNFFKKTNSLIVTGPTNTNVGDIIILIIG